MMTNQRCWSPVLRMYYAFHPVTPVESVSQIMGAVVKVTGAEG